MSKSTRHRARRLAPAAIALGLSLGAVVAGGQAATAAEGDTSVQDSGTSGVLVVGAPIGLVADFSSGPKIDDAALTVDGTLNVVGGGGIVDVRTTERALAEGDIEGLKYAEEIWRAAGAPNTQDARSGATGAVLTDLERADNFGGVFSTLPR